MDCIDPADHSAHHADVKCDAVALWRALLAEDTEGWTAITACTPCPACLAIQAAVLGISLTVAGPALNEAGRLVVSDAGREGLDRTLRGLLATVQDRGQASHPAKEGK